MFLFRQIFSLFQIEIFSFSDRRKMIPIHRILRDEISDEHIVIEKATWGGDGGGGRGGGGRGVEGRGGRQSGGFGVLIRRLRCRSRTRGLKTSLMTRRNIDDQRLFWFGIMIRCLLGGGVVACRAHLIRLLGGGVACRAPMIMIYLLWVSALSTSKAPTIYPLDDIGGGGVPRSTFFAVMICPLGGGSPLNVIQRILGGWPPTGT